VYRLWSRIPKLSFKICFFIILSHLFADLFFTDSPMSLVWPLELHWSKGYSGWLDVVSSVFLDAFQDVGIISVCLSILCTKRLIDARLKIFRSKFRKA
jgi:hypothetical protein